MGARTALSLTIPLFLGDIFGFAQKLYEEQKFGNDTAASATRKDLNSSLVRVVIVACIIPIMVAIQLACSGTANLVPIQ